MPVSWSLEVAELEARGLRAADSTGTSDPYVVFGGPACLCEAAGEPVLKTLNPKWPRGKLPTLQLVAESARTLAEDHVLLCIMDRDTVTADDLLGCAVLSFRTLRFADGADPFAGAWPPGGGAARASFKLPVVYSGVTMGSVSGTVRRGRSAWTSSTRAATSPPAPAPSPRSSAAPSPSPRDAPHPPPPSNFLC